MDVQPQSDIKEPTKYEHAIVGPLGPRWIASMREEWEALLSNGTFHPAVSRFDPRLRGRNITKSRWVYKIKLNRDGTIERYKSRFVVCGYSQRADLTLRSILPYSPNFLAIRHLMVGKPLLFFYNIWTPPKLERCISPEKWKYRQNSARMLKTSPIIMDLWPTPIPRGETAILIQCLATEYTFSVVW